MDDITSRLWAGDKWGDCKRDRCMCSLMDEAASEIDRLRAALSTAREDALKEAAAVATTPPSPDGFYTRGDEARANNIAIRILALIDKPQEQKP